MSEMVEKVARALFSRSVYHGYNDDTLKEMWARTAPSHRSTANAALDALIFAEDGSDCPEHVRLAGEEAYAENGDCRAIFNAMIRAIRTPGYSDNRTGKVR